MAAILAQGFETILTLKRPSDATAMASSSGPSSQEDVCVSIRQQRCDIRRARVTSP
jgi:hypothetical protein